eukprot:1055499_1
MCHLFSDMMRDIVMESYGMRYVYSYYHLYILSQFISFHHNFFQQFSIPDCLLSFPFRSLSLLHFTFLSDDQDATKSRRLPLWVPDLYQLLILESIAYYIFHFITLHCNANSL